MKVIFLDIDGVLNANDDFGGRGKPNPYVRDADGYRYCGISKSKVRRLKHVVDMTGAVIVLVSSWKRDYAEYLVDHENPVGKYLRNKLREFNLSIYDHTLRYDGSQGAYRGYEIQSWLKNHQDVKSWVILDDVYYEDYDWLKYDSHLVRTSEAYGLTDNLAEKAIQILNSEVSDEKNN